MVHFLKLILSTKRAEKHVTALQTDFNKFGSTAFRKAVLGHIRVRWKTNSQLWS